jgi:hypothetical protein
MAQSAKVFRVGVLTAGGGSSEELRQNLRDLGYIEGLNVIIEVRDTEGKLSEAMLSRPSWPVRT